MAYARFPTTRWSLLEVASMGEADEAAKLPDRFLRRYLPALKAHLVPFPGFSSRACSTKPINRADDFGHSF